MSSVANNLASILTRSTDEAAIISSGRTVTYNDLHQRVARWRGALTAAGVEPGDRVAIITGNNEHFVLAHLAALGIGALSTPLNPRSPALGVRQQIDTTDPKAVIIDGAGHELWNAVTKTNRDLTGRALVPQHLDFGEPHDLVPVEPESAAVLMYTSGTAGSPKPAILTHRNLITSLQAVLSSAPELAAERQVFLGIVPMFHILGLNTVLNLGLLLGATVVLEDFVNHDGVARLIGRHGVTVVAGPPTIWAGLCTAPAGLAGNFETVNYAVSGASRLPPAQKVEIENALGVTLYEGYGLTETSAVVASSIATDAPLGSIGRLLPGIQARIVDPDDNDCLVGDPGELLVRGPVVSPGYWNDPYTSSAVRTEDDWLHTGDIAVVDEEGYLTIVDRIKDLIIVSGFNVFPGEVETVLQSHPLVTDVAVAGEPSVQTGEAVVAFFVAHPELADSLESNGNGMSGAANQDAAIDLVLRDHCEERLARYKIPTRFVAVRELPIGPTGKIIRTRLQEQPNVSFEPANPEAD